MERLFNIVGSVVKLTGYVGSILAVIISWDIHDSGLWAIAHGGLGWAYFFLYSTGHESLVSDFPGFALVLLGLVGGILVFALVGSVFIGSILKFFNEQVEGSASKRRVKAASSKLARFHELLAKEERGRCSIDEKAELKVLTDEMSNSLR